MKKTSRRWMGIALRHSRLSEDAAYQNLLSRIESGDNGMHLNCPHCQHKAIIRTSKKVSDLTREAYCQCSNLACGHTFRAVLEVVETISPSAVPDPVVSAQLHHSKRAIELRERQQASGAAVATVTARGASYPSVLVREPA